MAESAIVDAESAAASERRSGRWWISRAGAGAVILRNEHARSPEPEGWRDVLAAMLRTIPGVVAVGAKRLSADGRVFSMGEFVVHPKSFHHHGQGVDRRCYRFPEEVDVIAGGVMAIDRSAFEAAGGVDGLDRELGAVELGLSLRRAGGRCIAVPHVVVVDESAPDPDDEQARTFSAQWGFDWNAADLDAVRQHHRRDGLLWHPRYHAPPLPFEKYRDRPAMHWQAYEQVEVYRKRADHLASLVRQICPGGRVLDLGCGDGLFAHLFALNGAVVVGIDPESGAIEQAENRIEPRHYPSARPRFLVGSAERLSLPDGSVDAVVMTDVIEHLPNPVAALRQAERVLVLGGALLISTPAWQYGHWSDPVYHATEYSMDQLVGQVQHATCLEVRERGEIKGVYRDLVVVARKAAR